MQCEELFLALHFYDILVLYEQNGARKVFMTFIKFLFVLALAVPLAVFMWNYINKLSDEFQKSVVHGQAKPARQPASGAAAEKKSAGKRKKPAGRKKPAEKKKQPERKQTSARPARPEGTVRTPSGFDQRQVPEHYDQLRSNFENSRMKQRYEESLHRDAPQAKQSEQKRTKTESKRKRRKARRNSKALQNRESRR